MKNLIAGWNIISKYSKKPDTICATHDLILVCPDVGEDSLSNEDKNALLAIEVLES